MSAYRVPGPLAKLPPRTPWWRLAWHWQTLLRWRDRAYLHACGIVHDPIRWRERFPLGDEEIDRLLPPSLRKGAA